MNGRGSVLLLTAPALVLMAVFLIGPLLAVIALSFTNYQLGAPSLSFIGIANYIEMTEDETVRISLANTLIYVGVVVPVSVALGLGAALLIEADSSLRGFYRASYFLPVMATLIAMAIVWEFMLDARFGAVNMALKAIGLGPFDFLHDRKLVLFTLCGIGVWQSVGFNMVLFMAGLTAVPRELYEAAAVDGATAAQRFRHVTLPGIRNIAIIVVLLSTIWTFNDFAIIYILTKGGPGGATQVLPVLTYEIAFGAQRLGEAIAVALYLLPPLAFVIIVLARYMRRGRAR